MLGREQDLLDPLLYGEQRGFAGVSDYGNNYAIEQFRSPLDNICVTKGNGVKAAWIDCNHKFGQRVGEWARGGDGEMGRWGETGRQGDVQNLPFSFFLLTVNCQLSTINCQLSTVNYQLSTIFYFLME